MRTLADMSPDERADCIGMWCDWRGPGLVILASHTSYASCFVIPRDGYRQCTHFHSEITPRPDLPRAWNPDGSPVTVDVEGDTVKPHPRGGMIGTAENPEYTDLPPGTRVRRHVTEWETRND